MNNLDTPEFGMLTGIIISLGLFAMIFGIVYLHKRERMAMIERGMDPRSYKYKQQAAPYQTLKWGMLLIGAGVGLFLAFTMDRTIFASTHYENEAIYFSLIAICGGLGLFTSFHMEKKGLHNGPGQE